MQSITERIFLLFGGLTNTPENGDSRTLRNCSVRLNYLTDLCLQLMFSLRCIVAFKSLGVRGAAIARAIQKILSKLTQDSVPK